MKRKYIDYKAVQWPEVNPIELVMSDVGGKSGQVRIQNYRYPTTQPNCKGIVQLIHGHGDYIGRYSYVAKQIAERGYDVVGIDQRGLGHSQGRRGLIESKEIARDDILNYTQKVNEKFGAPDLPHFSIGHSLGGAISLVIMAEAPENFKGCVLLTPFVALSPEV